MTAVNFPTLSITRTENILSGTGGGDGSNGPAILVNLTSQSTSVTQANGITSRVTTSGTNDAVAFYGVGTSQGTGTNSGFGAFFAGVANSATAGGIALGLQTNNQRGNDLAFNGASITAPVLFGVDIAYTSQTSGGTPTSNYGGAAAIIRAIHGKWDVGIGFVQGDMVRTAEIQSGTNSTYILQAAAGSHTDGINLVSGTFSGSPFKSTGFSVTATGAINATQTVAITGTTGDGYSVTDSTVTGVLTTSSLHTNSLAIGPSSNHPLVFIANNAEVGSVTETATTAPWIFGVASTRTGSLGLATSGGAGIGTLQYATSASSATLTFPATTTTIAGLAVAETFTQIQTITPTQAANTAADGLILADATAAPSSGNQQYSPSLVWTGSGWKTNATAGPQTVNARINMVPSQGAISPGVFMNFDTQINAGGYNTRFQIVDLIPDSNGLTVNFLGVASTQFALKLSGTTSAAFFIDTTQMLMGAVSNVPASIISNNITRATFPAAGWMTLAPATAIPAGGTQDLGYLFSSTAHFGIFFGSGLPTASMAQGSLYLRSDGAAGSRAYVNTNGTTTYHALATTNSVGYLISTSISVDFSVGGDNNVTIQLPVGITRITTVQVLISGASADISAATFGLFTATGGGGTAIISSGTAITVTTAADNTNNNIQNINATNVNTESFLPVANTIYFRIGTTAAAGRTANVQVSYRAVP